MTFPLSPITQGLGVRSGAIVPAERVSADPGPSWVLGAEGRLRARLAPGDYVEIAQAMEIPTGPGAPTYLRARAHLRAPLDPPPPGLSWQLSFRLEGSSRVELDLWDGIDAARIDVALPLHVAAGPVSAVVVRLSLVGAADLADLELPAAYIDGLLFDDTTLAPGLINRVPEPGEVGVPVGASVALEISDSSGGPMGLDETEVRLAGALAFSGGAFLPPFDGLGSAASLLDAGATLRIVIDPTEDFPPQTSIEVAVTTKTVTGALTALDPYAFTTEDLLAPELVAALAISQTAIRVTVNEPLGAGALELTSWTLALISTTLDDGLPALSPAVVGVTQFDQLVFDLTLDLEMTPGARYRVSAVVGAAVDLAGNPFEEPTNSVDLLGYAPVQPAGRRWDLLAMLPDANLAEDETRDMERFVRCLQRGSDLMLVQIDRFHEIFDVELAEERFVDLILAGLGNPFRFALSLLEKRRLALLLVRMYQEKGTPQGIINAVRALLGLEVTIYVPAFEQVWDLGVSLLGEDTYLGTDVLRTKLSFWVVSPIGLSARERELVATIARYVKDAREHLLGIQEPAPPPALPDHWELGLSHLGSETLLH